MPPNVTEWARSIAELGVAPEELVKSLQAVCGASSAPDQPITTSETKAALCTGRS